MRLLMIVLAIAVLAIPAEARPHRHGARHYVRHHHHAVHRGYRHVRRYRRSARYRNRYHRQRFAVEARGWASALKPLAGVPDAPWIGRALAHLGGNPTGWPRLWCGKFVRMMVPKDPGAAYDWAPNWAKYGTPSPPRPGAVAVLRGHVGFVYKDLGHSIVLLSGNYSHRVGIGVYPRARFIAFRWPPDQPDEVAKAAETP